MVRSKSALAVQLGKVAPFKAPKDRAEQYATDPELAADMLWLAYMQRDIEGRKVLDLGAGTGILGIGALMLGAKKVMFVENDKDAIEQLKENLSGFDSYEIIDKDATSTLPTADIVVTNPPFGTRDKHADICFLDSASKVAETVYSIHKSVTKDYIIGHAKKLGYRTTHHLEREIMLKRTQGFHTRSIHRIGVTVFRLQKDQPKA